MALSNSKTISQVESLTGFNISNEHCYTGKMISAIVNGINSELLGKAEISVNAHAGSTYTITGIDATSLANAIKSNLTGFNLDGQYAKGGALPDAIAKGIAETLTQSATVSVPTDGVGLFPIKGVSASLIASKMVSSLANAGFVLTGNHAAQMPIIDALSTAFSDAITSDAKYNVNGVAGGVFLMI